MRAPKRRASPARILLASSVAVGLLLLSAAPAAADTDTDTTKTEKTVHFLGFSADQSKAAWSIHVQRYGRDGPRRAIDRFTVVQVVRSIDNSLYASFKYGEIQRQDMGGRRIPAAPEELATVNPLWFEASPPSHWEVMQRGFQFGAARLTAATAVAVLADPDVALSVVPRRSGVVELRSDGNILGYTLAMASDSKATLGRYRHAVEVDQEPKGVLEIYISAKGDYVAVLNRFETIGARVTQPPAVTYGKIVPITSSGVTGGKTIHVRMPWGWKEMTPHEERVWRESRAQHLRFARMMNNFADGIY